jgi:hypothetical protein
MSVISLLTDFGNKDNFVGVMKAVILKINPQAKIIDLCHNVMPQDILQAAFLLKNSFKYFPKGTVHLAVVDPGVGTKRRKILVKTKDYHFVAPDNGVLDLSLQGENIEKIIEITNDKYFLKPVSNTFAGRDIFGPVAAYLSLGRSIDDFGKRIKGIRHLQIPSPKQVKNKLIGEVIYIDHFGNLITNITKDDFEDFVRNSRFKIYIAGRLINKISQSYQEVKKNKPLAIWNSFGNLEISVAQANAEECLSANLKTPIRIIKG